MSKLTPLQFLQKLNECTKEYRKQTLETRDEHDAAHFFNANLKSFIKSHPDEMATLSTMSFDRSFMSFVKMHLLKGS